MPSHRFQNNQLQKQRMLKSNLKEDLLKWICEKHATNSALDRKLLREKALQIAQSLELYNFKCSEQWLTNFLKKYGFSTSLTTCAGPYFKDYRLWINLIRSVLTQYRYKDIFHVDELTMYSDISPLRINLNPEESAENSSIINATNLISILFCCNSSGSDKLPALVTGTYKASILREDCRYHYNENSCISDEVFTDWLLSLNHIMSQKNRNILLLLHRYRIRALGKTQLSNIKLIFFPANFPPNLRPLRRDVFLSVKMKYRLNYAESILQPGIKWGLEEMIQAVLKAWNEVPRELIISSFQRTTFRSDDSLLEISSADWDKLNTGICFKRLVTFDDHLSDAPNSVNNDSKQTIRGKHKYNLRTSSHEVFQIEESADALKLVDNLREQHVLKTESLLTPRNDIEVTTVEDVNVNRENDCGREEGYSVVLNREENFENRNLENKNEGRNSPDGQGQASILGPSDIFTMMTDNSETPFAIGLKDGINSVSAIETNCTEEIFIFPFDENQGEDREDPHSKNEIDSQLMQDGGVDKELEEQLDSSTLLQIGSFENIDCDFEAATSLGKRNNNNNDNEDGPPEKIQKIDNNWSKQYENNYVFGPQKQVMPGPSTKNCDSECILKSCVPKKSQDSPKATKSGSNFIFTVTGTFRDPPCSPKE